MQAVTRLKGEDLIWELVKKGSNLAISCSPQNKKKSGKKQVGRIGSRIE